MPVLTGEEAGNDFGRSIVVGHIKGGETGLDVGFHRPSGCCRIQLAAFALHVGNLPEAGQDPRNAQIRGYVPSFNNALHVHLHFLRFQVSVFRFQDLVIRFPDTSYETTSFITKM